MTRMIVPIFAFLVIFIANPLFAQTNFVFVKDLSSGTSGQDVLELQRILNKDPRTRVALSGPGSLGNETFYFGSLTKAAVMKFQELYSGEILSPAGLMSATGYVGQLTRKKLNSLTFSAVGALQGPIATSNSAAATEKLTASPKVYRLSQYKASPGTNVIIYGENFSKLSNTIFLNSQKVSDGMKSFDGTTLSFDVPMISYGSYLVEVSTSFGSSKNDKIKISLSVSDTGSMPPAITAISKVNNEIIISGERFSASENNIYSSLGVVQKLPSQDLKTIRFQLQSLPYFANIENILNSGTSIEIWFYVQNDLGVNPDPFPFTLTSK